eukprot:1997337-Alexandrium_andersonii.AAC.1
MSASLVGSEMCIRDRLAASLCSTGRRIGDGSVAAGLGLLPDPVGPQPVSYTHLTLPTICSV